MSDGLSRVSPRTGNRAHSVDQRKDDTYETPAVAVAALLREQPLPHCIWEPACGPGGIVQPLRAAGHHVFASDLVCYPAADAAGWDFLLERACPPTHPPVEAIVTNPPFKNAVAFVQKARELVPVVVMLLRLAFVAGASPQRRGILDEGDLSRILVFSKRLPMMHRHGWEGPQASSMMDFAWFVWDRSHQGPATIKRISWEAI